MPKIGLGKINNIKIKDLIPKTSENGIEVKQYLSIKDKIEIVENVINSASINKYGLNHIEIELLFDLEIIYKYANITITEKQKEDIMALYDTLQINGILSTVKELIPLQELATLESYLYRSVGAVEKYLNSVKGLLETISQDYDSTKLNIEELVSKIKDPALQEFVKNFPNAV